jgi:hypothetical protein
MSTPSKNVHIYLKSDNDSTQRVFSKPDGQFDRYVILMNETLQVENRELRDSLKENEARAEELESENDRHDKGKTYIKGLLKNLVELDTLRKADTAINTEIHLTILKQVKNYKLQMYKNLQVLTVCLLVACIALAIYGSWVYAMICALLSCADIWSRCESITCFVTSNFAEKNESLKTIRAEIKIITDAQDFIHNHMDSL